MSYIRVYSNGQYFTIDRKIFSGGEVHVNIDFLPEQMHCCLVKCHLQSSDDIMHLLLIVDALQRKYPNLEGNINVAIPYMPYARQDRVCAPGDAFSIEVFAKILYAVGVRVVHTYDLHSEAAKNTLSRHNYLHVIEYDLYNIFSHNDILKQIVCDKNIILAAPDKGALPKIQKLSDHFRGEPILMGVKQRDPTTGALAGFDYHYEQSIEGKDVFIVDDICDGGGTFVGLAEKLKHNGARKIMLYVTHGIFSRGLEPFEGIIDCVFTTDSFRHEQLPKSEKVQLTVIHI